MSPGLPFDIDDYSSVMLQHRVTVESVSMGGLITPAFGRLEDVLRDADKLAKARGAHLVVVDRLPDQRHRGELVPAGGMLRHYVNGTPRANWAVRGELGV